MAANFFAYFDPNERIDSHDILFLICCPAHRRGDVKQELKKDGLTASEATSRRDMIPGHDKAFVSVSGGVSPASPKDLEGFYLRLVLIFSKGLSWLCLKEYLGEAFSFFLVNSVIIISNYAPKEQSSI